MQTFDFESAAYANFATPAAIENKLLTESYHFTNPTPQSNLGLPRIAAQINLAFATSINKDVVRRILACATTEKTWTFFGGETYHLRLIETSMIGGKATYEVHRHLACSMVAGLECICTRWSRRGHRRCYRP